jgi:hypothetical protein
VLRRRSVAGTITGDNPLSQPEYVRSRR